MKKFHEYYIEREVLSRVELPDNVVKEITKCLLNGLKYGETKNYLKGWLGIEIVKKDYEDVKSSILEASESLTESKKKWIQKAFEGVKRKGTEGKCTGKKFGGKSCPKGSKAYNMAKNLRNI